ncbi:MAG TPA: single-stranded DNA-binding protein [Bacteroidetes bacterium]|nr:MAG: single-stranded DNA-binding protein [Bacteroidota bacterium]RLD73938.1 MAG: single-stranded DNA-binding protein [Bacteroidota bacterium]RLD85990.1 MAG: single-stranded DNA-binding protein [Bacteroidota bacterium]HHL57663.1 single-stranded DNA-binding protein [Bacteroidota bacterium]
MTTLRNSVQLIGRLGVDPKSFEFDGGKMKVTFSLATSDYYKNKEGDRVEETQWHNIVAWGKTAKIAADYLSKGKEIALSGKLTNRSYEDKEGNKRYITEIVANEIVMLEKKN